MGVGPDAPASGCFGEFPRLYFEKDFDKEPRTDSCSGTGQSPLLNVYVTWARHDPVPPGLSTQVRGAGDQSPVLHSLVSLAGRGGRRALPRCLFPGEGRKAVAGKVAAGVMPGSAAEGGCGLPGPAPRTGEAGGGGEAESSPEQLCFLIKPWRWDWTAPPLERRHEL